MICLLMPVSILAILRFWLNIRKEPVEANELSSRVARNRLLTCYLGLAKITRMVVLGLSST